MENDTADSSFRPDCAPLVESGRVELHPQDMSATFAADITLDEAQEQLRPLGQWLPIDGDGSWGLGKLVELNSTGPLRLGYGAWRDLLLGCQFRNGEGELITAGGRTVKNVAGYDLTKLMVGQGGVLGRIVTLTARTYRRPDGAIVARFGADPRHLSSLMTTACRPQWAVMNHQALFCGYLGDRRTLDYWGTALSAFGPEQLIGRGFDEDQAHRRALLGDAAVAAGSGGQTFRAAVPPASILAFVSEANLSNWVADAAFGVVVAATDSSRRDLIAQAARKVGGTVCFFDENGLVEPTIATAQREMLRRLKIAFDPQNKLKPLPFVS